MSPSQGAASAAAPPPASTQVQSVDRALTVLEILARLGEVGVTDLATELGVHKSTAFRLVTALEQRQLVEQVGGRGKYRLGLGVLRLAAATTGRLDVSRESRPVCEELALELGDTVNVAILDSGAAINVVQEYGTASITARDWIGRRTPLHATSTGKVLLAHAPEPVRAAVLSAGLERYTPNTVVDVDSLVSELALVRERGWAATAEELEIGLHAVAAPVTDATGRVTAALSLSGPSYRLAVEEYPKIAARLVDGASRISERLGHYPSP